MLRPTSGRRVIQALRLPAERVWAGSARQAEHQIRDRVEVPLVDHHLAIRADQDSRPDPSYGGDRKLADGLTGGGQPGAPDPGTTGRPRNAETQYDGQSANADVFCRTDALRQPVELRQQQPVRCGELRPKRTVDLSRRADPVRAAPQLDRVDLCPVHRDT